ncbi:MAG: hypothetical protein ACQUYJ_11220, partial [Ferruginibacter sp.]
AYTKSIYRYCSKPSLPDLGSDILIEAAKRGNLDIIKFLLLSEVRSLHIIKHTDPNVSNSFGIRLAIFYGHLKNFFR